MVRCIGNFIYCFVVLFLKITAPVRETAVIVGLIRRYRKTGIKTIQAVLPLFGNHIMLSLTTRCQCACTHCGVASQMNLGAADLGTSAIREILRETARMGAYLVYFFGGEVLLRPDLPDHIAFANKKGLKTRLDTNGLLLNEEMVITLKNSGLDQIGISIDSLNEEIHDTNRGVKGALEKALGGISLCIKHSLDCYISTVASKQSIANGDIYNIIQMAKKFDIQVRILSPVACGRLKNRHDIVLTAPEVTQIRSFLERGKVFWDSELVDSPDSPFSCGARGRRLVYISPHGNVQPCSYIPVIFGNIMREPLAGILKRMRNSPILNENTDSPDCPTNSINFYKNYSAYLETGAVMPAEDCFK